MMWKDFHIDFQIYIYMVDYIEHMNLDEMLASIAKFI